MEYNVVEKVMASILHYKKSLMVDSTTMKKYIMLRRLKI